MEFLTKHIDLGVPGVPGPKGPLSTVGAWFPTGKNSKASQCGVQKGRELISEAVR